MASYLAEVLAFLVLCYLTYRYVWPWLSKAMDRQAESIRSSLSSADASLESGQSMLTDARAALEAAHSDVAAIIARAHETSAQLLLEGERRGREEYERLVAAAASEATFERQRALEDVIRQIGAVVMSATERVVAVEMDAALQRAFISQAIDAAEAMA